MTETNNQTFLTTLPDEKQVTSIVIHDYEDDTDIDVKSSADSGDTPMANDEIEEILNKNLSQEVSSILIPNNANDNLQDKMSHNDPSPSAIGEHLQTVIPRAVYDYAAIVHEKLESPRQNKLDHDVNAVLGSTDPPPGFGFLHPRFYYLEQKRPIPMEPLRVWRGYNGHVYFSPIQVQQLEVDRVISPTKPRRPPGIRTVQSSTKAPDRTRTVLSAYRNKQSSQKYMKTADRMHNEQSFTSRKAYAQATSDDHPLKNNTFVTLIEGAANHEEENKRGKKQMWRSIATCVPVQVKPMSKRNQYDIEDIQKLQHERSSQDSTSYHRQILPNIRPIQKSKFLHKGLAYKEVRKVPGINDENRSVDNTDTLKKPLVDYNLAQAYVRHEVNATRSKQTILPPPPSTVTVATSSIMKEHQLTKNPTSLDMREIRKRIVKGTTFGNRSGPQSASWTPGHPDNSSSLSSENVLLRPSTSKSSIPLKQTTAVEMPILTKYVNRPRSILRYTPTAEIAADET